MTINPVKDEDYGVVSCTLSNKAGQASATAMLKVIGNHSNASFTTASEVTILRRD